MSAPNPLPEYSVVIPAYNSAAILPRLTSKLEAFFAARGATREIILVNDGSADDTWQMIAALCAANPNIVGLGLSRNFGQHAALLCGLAEARGRWVVTMDDDLENDPDDIGKLIAEAVNGHDLVFGRYPTGRHRGLRRLGSATMRALICYLCHAPRGLYVSNFRLMRREVVDRMLARSTGWSNVSCLALHSANCPADAEVDYRPRPEGRSQYTLLRLARLMLRTVAAHAVSGRTPKQRFDHVAIVTQRISHG